MITDEKLEQLRRDAMATHNGALVLACGKALRGDQAARRDIENALNDLGPATFFITTTVFKYGDLARYMMEHEIYAPSSTCGDEVTVAFAATPGQIADLTGLGFTVEGA